MKKLLFVILFLLIFLNSNVISGKGRKLEKIKYPPLGDIKKPQILTAELDNGIKIKLIQDQKFPVVNFTIYLK